MKRIVLSAAAAAMLAACSEAPVQNQAAAVPAKLTPGQYEVTATVASFRSTDGKTPVISVKPGETITSQACVGADGAPPPELFAAKGDVCTVESPYVRNGRMNLTLNCTREGTSGRIMSQVNGKYTADSLNGSAETSTSLYGDGDYQLTTDLAGRRVGECTAANPNAGPAA